MTSERVSGDVDKFETMQMGERGDNLAAAPNSERVGGQKRRSAARSTRRPSSRRRGAQQRQITSVANADDDWVVKWRSTVAPTISASNI